MSVYRLAFLECDRCGTDFDDMQARVRDLRENAESVGWIREAKRDLCPACVAQLEAARR